MKNKKKIVWISIIILIIIIAAITLVVCCLKGKDSAKDTSKSKLLSYLPPLDKEQIQTVECDGMKISMISCIFDEETGIGKCIFEIKSDSGEIETGRPYFQHNGTWYSLQCSGGGGLSNDYDVIDGVTYMYLEYTTMEADTFVGLYETEDLDNEVARFDVQEYKSDELLYFGSGKEIVLSSVGFKGENTGILQDSMKITLVYSDGKEKDIKISGSYKDGNIRLYEFWKAIDIKGVVSIKGNGQTYDINEE